MSDIWTIHRLTSGDLTLEILPGLGGRLWDIRFAGQSLLFQNPDLINHIPDLQNTHQLPSRSPHFGFPLWGGEKTWVAPDRDWKNNAPFPMLDSGPYEIVSQGFQQIELQSAICPDSGLRITRHLQVSSANSWSMTHRITNHAAQERYSGIWSVLMLDRPAIIGLETGPAPISAVFGDAGEQITTQPPFAICRCDHAREYKIGMHNAKGQVFIRTGTSENPLWMRVTTQAFDPNGAYAHDHDFEIFNSKDYAYCEAEWHSPATLLQSGQSMRFKQDFTLQPQAAQFSCAQTTLNELELFTCMS